MTTKAQHLRRASQAQKVLAGAERSRDLAAATRDSNLLAAQALGASRAELEQATGLSTARITQVLRRAKTATTTTDSGE